ncbi:MAG: RNA polymerase sigma factor RpoD/SigA [Planctomycetota bacterium]
MGRERGTGTEESLEVYLREIGKIPLFTPKEERDFSRRARRGDKVARDRMIRSNLRLAVSIAKLYSNRGLPLVDLIEEGNLGLLKAVERFNPDQGYKFSTYATWWIKQSIRRALINKARAVRIPAYMVETIAKWKKASVELSQRLNHSPSAEEVADELDIEPGRMGIIKKALRASSPSDRTLSSDMLWALRDEVVDEETRRPEECAFSQCEREMIERLLHAITEREADILRMRYGLTGGDPMTFEAIGRKLRLTRERIRQIEHRALRRLHVIINREEEETGSLRRPANRTKRKG